MGKKKNPRDLGAPARHTIPTWLHIEPDGEEADEERTESENRRSSEVGLVFVGGLQDLPESGATQPSGTTTPSSGKLRHKQNLIQCAKQEIFETMQQLWGKTKVAQEFMDSHEVCKVLFQYMITPGVERPSLQEFGAQLQWRAHRSKPYTLDDVKYRLETVLQELREALRIFVTKHEREITNAEGDPEQVRENIGSLYMRRLRKIINDRTDRRE